jgi:hypothetical protein
MATTPPKILFISMDATLLESRCAVLAHSGYQVIAATVPEAYRSLRAHNFALVVVSKRLVADRKEILGVLPIQTPALLLDEFIFPKEMLAAVEKQLQRPPHGIALVPPSQLGGNSGASRKAFTPKGNRETISAARFKSESEEAALDRNGFLSLLQLEDQAATTLQQLFDEWVGTGLDESGAERPRERRIGATVVARRYLEEYVEHHPPKLILGDGEHAVMLSDLDASATRFSGSRTAGDSHEQKAANVFLRFLGQAWCFEFAKCRECSRRFDMKRPPAKNYQFGIHCAQHRRLQSYKAATVATKTARNKRRVDLLSLAARAVRDGEHGTRQSANQILEKIFQQESIGAKHLGITTHWIARNREEIEKLARDKHGSGQAVPL